MEAEGAPGKESGCQHPVGSGDSDSKSALSEKGSVDPERMLLKYTGEERVESGWVEGWLEHIQGADITQRKEELIGSPGRLPVGPDVEAGL